MTRSTPSPEPRAAAFFDVDCTLLEINSGSAWFRRQRRRGEIGLSTALRSLMWLGLYRLSLLNYEAVAREVLSPYRGALEADVYEDVARWYREEVQMHLCVQGREAVEWHRARGDALVLLTSGSRFLNTLVARDLDVPHLLCTEVEVVEGRLTGAYQEPACYGAGKVTWAERFAAREGISMAHSHFYSDSFSDRPMLDRVGHPHAINPDPRLRRYARARGWPIETWSAA